MERNVAVRAATYLFILSMAITASAMSRVLEEEQSPSAAPPASPVPVVTPVAPATATVVANAPAAIATTSGGTGDHQLTFFMHDILGGSNPSARAVTGVVTNTAVNGQLPFGKPNGAILPVNGGVPLNSANNGIINNNNVPFLTGLGGTTTGVIQNNGNGGFINGGGANGLPFFTGGNLPAGSTLQKLLFGTMTVIDDELTEGHESGSGMVGKAQGFYVVSSEDGSSQTLAFTTMFKEGEYADSLSFFGVHRTADSESHIAVVGGTGKYVKAKGYATVQTLRPVEQQHSTDGAETLLQFTVYLVV